MAQPLPVEWRKDSLPQEMTDLRTGLEQLAAPSRDRLLRLCDRLGHHYRLQSKLVNLAQETVDQLQLDVKYLLFDLETTRRERDELHELLEELEDD